MIPADLEQIAAIVGAAERRSGVAIGKAKEETIEAMRDMQSEILKNIEAISCGNLARMHRLETSDAATVAQLAAMEERVMRLELRQRPTQ